MTAIAEFCEYATQSTVGKKLVVWLLGDDSAISNMQADAYIVNPNFKGSLPDGSLKFAAIISFFGIAMQEREDIAELMGIDPVTSGEILDRAQEACAANIQVAMQAGFDGFVYVLVGAEPKYLSPMQYGGFILDQDREILSRFTNLPNRLLYVIGGNETYMDALSDLSASSIGWDESNVQFGIETMRKLAQKPIFGDHPDSDIQLETFGEPIQWNQLLKVKETQNS